MKKSLLTLIRRLEEKIRMNKEYLNHLDTIIGDGDHGTNMSNAFAQARAKIATSDTDDLGEVLSLFGEAFLEVGGGASPYIYGTTLVRVAEHLKVEPESDFITFKVFFDLFTMQMKEIGMVEAGQKTMYDAFYAANTVLQNSQKNCVQTMRDVAYATDKAMLESKDFEAEKGRASYFGERSKGEIDPGTYSASVIVTEMFEFVLHEALLELLENK